MTVADIPEVYTIEVHSFTAPWKKESFVYEILHNQYSHYFLIEEDGLTCWVLRGLDRHGRCTNYEHCDSP